MASETRPGMTHGNLRDEMRAFYKTSRPYAGHLAAEDQLYFKRYLAFIDRYAPNADTILDAGCGTGLSTCLLSRNRRQVVGMDLSELFLRDGKPREEKQNLLLVAGDILDLPFQDESFDLVSSYLVIEFLPSVPRGLEEMSRVLRKKGILLILAPNLLSPVWPLRDLFRMLAGGPPRPVWCENPKAALTTFWRNFRLSLRKAFEHDPEFIYRRPDLSCQKAVGRDSDSVYLAHPGDLCRFLRQRGFRILRSGSRSLVFERLSHFFSVTVEVVAEKVGT